MCLMRVLTCLPSPPHYSGHPRAHIAAHFRHTHGSVHRAWNSATLKLHTPARHPCAHCTSAQHAHVAVAEACPDGLVHKDHAAWAGTGSWAVSSSAQAIHSVVGQQRSKAGARMGAPPSCCCVLAQVTGSPGKACRSCLAAPSLVVVVPPIRRLRQRAGAVQVVWPVLCRGLGHPNM